MSAFRAWLAKAQPLLSVEVLPESMALVRDGMELAWNAALEQASPSELDIDPATHPSYAGGSSSPRDDLRECAEYQGQRPPHRRQGGEETSLQQFDGTNTVQWFVRSSRSPLWNPHGEPMTLIPCHRKDSENGR